MRIPERWLRAYCDPAIDSATLAQRLTMGGLEVEEQRPYAPPFAGVVVARVLEVARHPAVDRLTVCRVDVGAASPAGKPLEIVCGAPNVRVGMLTACALPGARLPGGVEIRESAMRGVTSQGMLCSSRELGLDDDHRGIMDLPAGSAPAGSAPAELAPGADLRAALALDESVLTLKLTPNLAHCMSVTGVAREVAAITDTPYRPPSWQPVVPTLSDHLPVTIAAPELCGRWSGRIVRGVDARAPTPAWIRERLERAGQRSISALVDLSNYVMLELGRPTHVFDLAKIGGGLTVRWGRDGESLELLNGQTIALGPRDGLPVGVIADEHQVESLAGIMGGESTAVTLDTRDIYLEAAFWWPTSIAGRPRRYNFRTDAAQRFERGVDAETTADHLEYLTGLVLAVCGGQAGPVDDQITGMPTRPPVALRVGRLRRVSGLALGAADCRDAFRRLDLPFTETADGSGDVVFAVTPPPRRFDLTIEEDLIEEVVRLYGFERIVAQPPRGRAAMRPAPEAQLSTLALKRRWVARDYQEVVNYSFVWSADEARYGTGTVAPIRLVNPIAENLDVMRTTLWSGLLANLAHNLNRKADRVRLFELGRAYLRAPAQPDSELAVAGIAQPLRLAALAYGPVLDEQWGAPHRHADFFDLKGDLQAAHPEQAFEFRPAEHPALHPGQSARIDAGGVAAGWIGALHPRLAEALDLPHPVLLLELDAAPLLLRPLPSPQPTSKYPPAIRDLAVVVSDQVLAGDLLNQIRSFCSGEATTACVRNVKLFDEYRGKALENKEKSLAFRFWMQDTDRTLSDAEVDAAMAMVLDFLVRNHAARLRA
ncbi:MAG: phenylalanine--tRNA ligase subunit beta [Lautropia sp.]